MAFWMKKLAGKVAGEDDEGKGDDQAAAEAEEERREAEEERRKAEEQRRRQEEAKARAEAAEEARRQREEEQREREERLAAEQAEREAELESAAEAPPVIELEEQRIEVPGVSIPEDQIEVTPGPPPGPAPAPMEPPPDRAMQPPSPEPLPQPPPGDPALMARIADLGIATGSQQGMAAQGYGPPPDPAAQRQALATLAGAEQRTAETGAALAPPTPQPMPQPGGPQATGMSAPKAPMGPMPEEQPDPGLRQLQAAADAAGDRPDARAEELAKAQRRDRILKAIRGLLGLSGIIGGTVAQMRGNPAGQLAGAGVAGLGRFVGSLGGYGDDTRRRQQGERQDETLAASQRRALQSATNYDRQLSQTDEAQRQRQALAKMRLDDRRVAQDRAAALAEENAPVEREAMLARIARLTSQTRQDNVETDIEQASNDPASDRSRVAQRTIAANLETLRRRGVTLPEGDIENMSEVQLRPYTQALARITGSRRPGAGGGGRRSGGSITTDRAPASYRDAIMADYPDATPADVDRSWARLTAEDRAGWSGGVTARQYRGEQESREQATVSTPSGDWTYQGEGAPSQDAADRARTGADGWNKLQEQVAAMRRIANDADVIDGLRGGSFNFGSQAGIAYLAAKTEAEYAIRNIRAMGALAGEERQELRDAIPSLRQLTMPGRDADAMLDSVLSANRRTFLSGMETLRFAPAEPSGRGGGSSGARRYIVTTRDGDRPPRELTPDQIERLEAAGARVRPAP